MNVLLDEGVPKALRNKLSGHTVETVKSQGWLGIKNGSLLRLITRAGFEVLITADKNMRHQQPIEQFPFAVLLLSTNHWPTLQHILEVISDALKVVLPGKTTQVDCGVFLPAKHSKK